jgi:hypothetical protein
MFITPNIRILQRFVLAVTAVTIVMGISTLAMMTIPQTGAYATQDEDCDSDELPARIDGTIRCMEEGECYSYEFEGKEVKHCNY